MNIRCFELFFTNFKRSLEILSFSLKDSWNSEKCSSKSTEKTTDLTKTLQLQVQFLRNWKQKLPKQPNNCVQNLYISKSPEKSVLSENRLRYRRERALTSLVDGQAREPRPRLDSSTASHRATLRVRNHPRTLAESEQFNNACSSDKLSKSG